MEPGHEDREYIEVPETVTNNSVPQWSPVMKTGNTTFSHPGCGCSVWASMEPGHEDREYRAHDRPAQR